MRTSLRQSGRTGTRDLVERLRRSWRGEVTRIAVSFVAQVDDERGRWKKGDALEMRIELVKGRYVCVTRNLRAGTRIAGLVREQRVPRSAFTLFVNGARGARPRLSGRCGFGCGLRKHPLSVLRRRILATISTGARDWNVVSNASPLSPRGSYLLLRCDGSGRLIHQPQEDARSAEILAEILAIAGKTTARGSILFVNGPRSGASVPEHLHVQLVDLGNRDLPLARALRQRRAGKLTHLDGYPGRPATFRLADPPPVDDLVRYLRGALGFNLVFIRGTGAVFLRRRETVRLAHFELRPAGMELAGRVVVPGPVDVMPRDVEEFIGNAC